jgi:hypothetical protein
VTYKQEIEICPHGRIVCGIAQNKDDIGQKKTTFKYSLDYLAIRGESSSSYIKQLPGARRRRKHRH